MQVTEGFTDKLGNVKEYFKQLKFCWELGWRQPYQVYKSWKPKCHLELLNEAVKFAAENRPVNLRQIYYHLVSVQLLYSGNYQLPKRLLVRARNCGLIPMDWIEDRTRKRVHPGVWKSMRDIQEAAIHQYRRDLQLDQPKYIEVWLEKRALENIFHEVTAQYGVYLLPCGGSQSTSMMWESAQYFKNAILRGQQPEIEYFGDLNASGKNMILDIKKRLELYGVPNVTVNEGALNEDDVIKHNLPRNPQKTKDSRAKWFAEKYPSVKYSVELDALPPAILREKIRKAIESNLEINLLKRNQRLDEEMRRETSRYMEKLWKQQEQEELDRIVIDPSRLPENSGLWRKPP
jgi:hypothetical protein